MELKKVARVGTLESSDIQIVAKPNPNSGLIINLESVVKTQFGDAILATVKGVLSDFEVENAIVEINDKGALDHVIKARMQAVLCRVGEIYDYDWGREWRECQILCWEDHYYM